MYTTGSGVPVNYEEAAKWCHQAAEQGEASGQYSLGFMYNKGTGLPQDAVLAHMWVNLSSGNGHQGALKARILLET
jgi:TPR repeat protein